MCRSCLTEFGIFVLGKLFRPTDRLQMKEVSRRHEIMKEIELLGEPIVDCVCSRVARARVLSHIASSERATKQFNSTRALLTRMLGETTKLLSANSLNWFAERYGTSGGELCNRRFRE